MRKVLSKVLLALASSGAAGWMAIVAIAAIALSGFVVYAMLLLSLGR